MINKDNIAVSRSTRIKKGTYIVTDSDRNGVIQITADDVVLDFQGAQLVALRNPHAGDQDQFEGFGVFLNGHKNVVIKNATIQGFQFNVRALGCNDLRIEDCDVSYSRAERVARAGQPIDIWLDLRNIEAWRQYGAGIWLGKCRDCKVTGVRATGAQNGVILAFCEACTVHDNYLAFNSGWGVGLWSSSKNVVSWNRADFCNRLHNGNWGSDSAGLALAHESHENFIVGNSLTYGGDGFFLTDGGNNGTHTSNGNLVAYNDGSWSENNAFESTFSTRNVFFRNTASDSGYGFWLGYSQDNLVAENIIERNFREGVSIGAGQRNRIVKNMFRDNKEIAVHLSTDEGPDVVESKDSLVMDNVIKNSRLAFSLERSTGTILIGNKLENAPAPKVAAAKRSDAPYRPQTFLDSDEAKKIEEIKKSKPKQFRAFRHEPVNHGRHLLQLGDFAPRDPRPVNRRKP